jgi:hypothetical protein
MKQNRGFVHPAMPERLVRFFPSTVLLQHATLTPNSVGERTKTWSTVHTCKGRFAQGALNQPRSGDVPTIYSSHRAQLLGAYDDVRPDTWRAVIDNVGYDIVSVDWAEGMFTLLEMNQTSPVPVTAG